MARRGTKISATERSFSQLENLIHFAQNKTSIVFEKKRPACTYGADIGSKVIVCPLVNDYSAGSALKRLKKYRRIEITPAAYSLCCPSCVDVKIRKRMIFVPRPAEL